MMKAFKLCLGVGLGVLLAAVPARAQFGLPVAESYEARETGILDFTGGAVLSEDRQFYGVRDTISVLQDLRLFVDVGLADADRNDQNLAVQGGLIWCLPVDTSDVDLGLRTSGYWFNGNVDEIYGFSALLMASGNPIFEGLYVYGGSGVDYRNTKTDLVELEMDQSAGKDEISDDKLRAVVTVGALMPITERFWVFTEATYNEDPFIAIGIRTR